MNRRPDTILFFFLWGVAAWIGCALRLDGAGLRPLFGDEYHTVGELGKSYSEVFASFGTWGSHASLPLLQKACMDVFGSSAWTFRLPALVPGLLVLLLTYPVARGFVGRTAALLTTWAVALSPMLVFYGHFARTYSLAVLLALGVAHFARRALTDEGTKRDWIASAACGALLPWAHLSTLGFLVGIAVASLALAWRDTRSVRAPLIAFGAAALASALLYLPALDAVRAYVEKVSGERGTAGEVGFLEVATLLFGSRSMGIAGPILAAVATLAFARSDRTGGVLVVGGALGLIVAFFASRPYGLAYAYARYFVVLLPFLWMALAWGLVQLISRATSQAQNALSTSGEHVARAAGILVLVGLHLAGPLAPTRPGDEPFGNSYLAMRALPAFDVPYAEMPAIYRELGDAVVVAPALTTRSALLYRNYALQHDARVWTGMFGTVPPLLHATPYVSLLDQEAVRETGASHLILHRDAAGETAAYWNFVYGIAWPELGGSDDHPDAGLMRRQQRFAPPSPFPPPLEQALRQRYGEPAVETAAVLAWKL